MAAVQIFDSVSMMVQFSESSTYSWETREQFKLVLIESSESALVIGHLELTFKLTFFYPVREVFIEIKKCPQFLHLQI